VPNIISPIWELGWDILPGYSSGTSVLSEVYRVFVSLPEISHQVGRQFPVAARQLKQTLRVFFDIERRIELAIVQNLPSRQVLPIPLRPVPEVGDEAGDIPTFGFSSSAR
jgi:hypothetical protein